MVARAAYARMHRLAILAAFACLAGFTAAAGVTEARAEAGAGAAEARIENLSNKLINVMRNADRLGYSGRYRELEPVLRDSYNFDLMARYSVGRRNWQSFTEDQQKRFRELFTRMSISTYAARFKGYSGQSFEVAGHKRYGNDVMVRSQLNNPDGDDVELNYRMRQFGGEWQIIDVYLEGRISELAKNRSEFAAVLKREGYDGLISSIQDIISRNERNGAS